MRQLGVLEEKALSLSLSVLPSFAALPMSSWVGCMKTADANDCEQRVAFSDAGED